MVQYLLFLLTLVLVSQRVVIKNNILRILGKSKPLKTIQDKKLSSFIKSKTGLSISTLKLINDQKPHAAMIGIPGKPVMVMSSGLYDNFTEEEKEYVALHEAGHYQLKHSIKIFIVVFLLFLVGALLLSIATELKLFVSVVLGILLGIISIQYQKRTEIEADMFAASRMNDPNGMISATNKFEKAWGDNSTFLNFLFNARVPYSERIKIANKYYLSQK